MSDIPVILRATTGYRHHTAMREECTINHGFKDVGTNNIQGRGLLKMKTNNNTQKALPSNWNLEATMLKFLSSSAFLAHIAHGVEPKSFSFKTVFLFTVLYITNNLICV